MLPSCINVFSPLFTGASVLPLLFLSQTQFAHVQNGFLNGYILPQVQQHGSFYHRRYGNSTRTASAPTAAKVCDFARVLERPLRYKLWIVVKVILVKLFYDFTLSLELSSRYRNPGPSSENSSPSPSINSQYHRYSSSSKLGSTDDTFDAVRSFMPRFNNGMLFQVIRMDLTILRPPAVFLLSFSVKSLLVSEV